MRHIKTRIITLANQKGGVAKTTTAFELAAYYAATGSRVLLIDADEQRNLTTIAGAKSAPSLFSVLAGECSAPEAIHETGREDLHIIPATKKLASAGSDLAGRGAEKRLSRELEKLRGTYDFIIIDTPRQVDFVTTSAFLASDYVLFLAEPSTFSLQGIFDLKGNIKAVREYQAKAGADPVKVAGILFTRYPAGSILIDTIEEALEATEEELEAPIFNTKIRTCQAINNAYARRQSVREYAPRSNAAKDYQAAAEELREKTR